jgi:hypothetical protein
MTVNQVFWTIDKLPRLPDGVTRLFHLEKRIICHLRSLLLHSELENYNSGWNYFTEMLLVVLS